jgi:hypothetical protein
MVFWPSLCYDAQHGEVPERSKGHAWKACVRFSRTEGSNPSLSAKRSAGPKGPGYHWLDKRMRTRAEGSLKSMMLIEMKARLSLSLIAAQTPMLLILDKITNNLDLETKEHVVDVLKKYPGAMNIVSHEMDFLQAIGIDHMITIADGCAIT